jgi:capsular polysaccharide biosynthesis protein
VSPPKAIIMLLGLVLATFGAVALAYVCENYDDPWKTANDKETDLDSSVLDAIPSRQRVVATPK